MRRVLAVVAAIAMVAGSLALRSRLDRKSSDQSQVLRLTCVTELEQACSVLAKDDSRIHLTVEPAGTTADRLATREGDLGLDGWLTTAPWPDIVDQERRSHSLDLLFAPGRSALARSPLVIAVRKDRAGVLGPRCPGGAVQWRCLGEAAGTSGGWAAIGGRPEWGPVKVGHGPPPTDGVGLSVLGQAVATWFGRTDVSTADLDDGAFQAWFAGLERSVPVSAASSLETMLVNPAAFDAVGTTEAEAGPLLARSARAKDVDLLYPSPMATVDVVLAVPVGNAKAASTLRGVVGGSAGGRALAASGWRVDGQARPQGVADSPPIPATANLPSPGLLDALRTRWHEVTGK